MTPTHEEFDFVTHRSEQIKRIHALGKRVNAETHWHISMEIARSLAPLNFRVNHKHIHMEADILTAYVHLYPTVPFSSEAQHNAYIENMVGQLDGIVNVLTTLLGEAPTKTDPVAEQNKLIGVIH